MGMTLVEDGFEDPLPGRPRRSAYLVAVVVAMVLGAGTAFVLTGHGSPAPAHGAPAPTASPTDPGPALVAPADSPIPSVSPAASPSPVPRRTVTRTGPRPSASPSASPSPPPAFYNVTKPVCRYVDFAPINALTTPAGKPDVSSNEQHFQGADNILFYCNGVSGNVTVKRINVMYYPNGAQAAAAYADTKAQAPETIDQVSGIGTDAWGWYFDAKTYEVIALANNITLQVILIMRSPGTNFADLRPAAITVARTMLPKLRVS